MRLGTLEVGHTALVIDAETTERTIITSFVDKRRQERLLGFVGNPRARGKLREELVDLSRMNQRFIIPIPPSLQGSTQTRQLLTKMGAPPECYLICEKSAWDGVRMPLEKALGLIVASGWKALVSCRPDSLLYYEGEAPGLRVILSPGGAVKKGI
jgi:hypothetical protein